LLISEKGSADYYPQQVPGGGTFTGIDPVVKKDLT